MLESLVPLPSEIEETRERAIARMERGFHLGGKPLSRDDLYEDHDLAG